jgi:hypothetical protein
MPTIPNELEQTTYPEHRTLSGAIAHWFAEVALERFRLLLSFSSAGLPKG